MKRFLLLGVLLCAMQTVSASTWRVDVLIYSDRYHDLEGSSELYFAPGSYDDVQAIPLHDRERLAAAGIRVLDGDNSVLRSQWSRIANSQRFEPVLQVSWMQNDPPQRGGPRLLLRHGHIIATAQGPLAQLEGTLRLTLRRFLHLDVDLQWTESDGWDHHATTLREHRRMRSSELHHLDNPRFGVLAHVLRADD